MKGEDALLGHEVVHDAEEALLHLPRVLRPEDHHLPALQAQIDARRRGHGVREAVAGEAPGVVDGEIRGPELREFLGARPNTPILMIASIELY